MATETREQGKTSADGILYLLNEVKNLKEDITTKAKLEFLNYQKKFLEKKKKRADEKYTETNTNLYKEYLRMHKFFRISFKEIIVILKLLMFLNLNFKCIVFKVVFKLL